MMKPSLRNKLLSIFPTKAVSRGRILSKKKKVKQSFQYPLPRNYLCHKILKQNKNQPQWWLKATKSKENIYHNFSYYKEMNIWKRGLIVFHFTSFSILICFNCMTWQIIKCKQVHHSNTSFIEYFKEIQFTVTFVLFLSYNWKLFGMH